MARHNQLQNVSSNALNRPAWKLGHSFAISPPKWIKHQFTRLVDEAPVGDGWLHELKYGG